MARVNDFVVARWHLSHDAQPAERIDAFEMPTRARRDVSVTHSVVSIAAGDEIAIQPLRFPVFHIGDERLLTFDVVDRNVRSFEHRRHTAQKGRVDEILHNLGLAVDRHAGVDAETIEIDLE